MFVTRFDRYAFALVLSLLTTGLFPVPAVSAPVPRAAAPDPLGRAYLGCEFDTGWVFGPNGQPVAVTGLPVTSVYGDSAAQRAGLWPGDVVNEFNGIKLAGDTRSALFYDLKRELALLRPGATIPVVIDRNGETKTIRVRLSDTMGTPPEPAIVIIEPEDP